MAKEKSDPEAELGALLSDASPFGPASADEVGSRTAAKALYDDENEIHHVLRASNPVFLIGRRGSGKTAVLRGTYPEGGLDVDVDAATTLSAVGAALGALRIPGAVSYAELVPPIWEAAFVAALCARIHSEYCQLQEADCPAAFAFGSLDFVSTAGAATDAASEFLQLARESAPEGGISNIRRFLDLLEVNGVPLWKARDELVQAADKAGCQAVVSIDSLDQYGGLLDQSGVQMTRDGEALQGLFRAAAETGRSTKSIYKVRISFPAELWHFYKEFSSNPLKDFDNSVLLHWDGGELLKLTGRRLLNYLRLHHGEEYRRLGSERSNSGDKWAQALLTRYLPAETTNSMGQTEPTVAYILRHTQLLPRHLIYLLNEVLQDQDFREGAVDSDHVRISVNQAATQVAETIVNAYLLPYPDLQEICEEVIPRLNIRFSGSELQKVINRTPYRGEFRRILRMLVEVGVVGRVLTEDSRYLKADFEYRYQSRMFVLDEDDLCLHPVFASTFDCMALTNPDAPENQRPVYPFGSDIDNDTARRVIHLTRDDL